MPVELTVLLPAIDGEFVWRLAICIHQKVVKGLVRRVVIRWDAENRMQKLENFSKLFSRHIK